MYKRLKETYKPQYEPHIWNNNKFLKESHNCYSYFLNDINNDLSNIYKQQSNEEIKKSLNPQPGHYCGMTKLVNYNETTCKSLIERVLCDNPDIQFIDTKDNNSFNCPANYYKGALAIDKGNMYHFYRQDENGEWSHKDGGQEVTNLDYGGNKIRDPKYSDRGRYNEFCGYFCVPENDYNDTNMARNNYFEKRLWYRN